MSADSGCHAHMVISMLCIFTLPPLFHGVENLFLNEVAELRLRSYISLKVAELWLQKSFLQIVELRLQTKQKVERAHLCCHH